ncbi:hypothetical protein AB0H42_25925 [Nocardia sp. NPDC050799]|uniref:hypothetical protein n=1 Tax=Nocardia sp. NPDC050799 TaxID=3154842 RepID=UPI0034010D87
MSFRLAAYAVCIEDGRVLVTRPYVVDFEREQVHRKEQLSDSDADPAHGEKSKPRHASTDSSAIPFRAILAANS